MRDKNKRNLTHSVVYYDVSYYTFLLARPLFVHSELQTQRGSSIPLNRMLEVRSSKKFIVHLPIKGYPTTDTDPNRKLPLETGRGMYKYLTPK